MDVPEHDSHNDTKLHLDKDRRRCGAPSLDALKYTAPSGESLVPTIEAITGRYFGDQSAAQVIASWRSVVDRMALGAAEYGRPAERKRRLSQAAIASRALLNSLAVLPIEDRLRALRPMRDPIRVVAPDAPHLREGDIEISPPRLGITPVVNDEYHRFLITLASMEAGLRRMAKTEPLATTGRSPTPDALAFLVECLATIWREQKGVPPATASIKRGTFGSMVADVAAVGEHPFGLTEVRTALRVFFRRPTGASPT